MKTYWLKNILLGVAMIAASAGIVHAETRNSMPFTDYGVIDNAPVEGSLVISDRLLRLGSEANVHKLGGQAATLRDLKVGTKVGFNAYGERPPYYISDIWVLPGNFDFRSLETD